MNCRIYSTELNTKVCSRYTLSSTDDVSKMLSVYTTSRHAVMVVDDKEITIVRNGYPITSLYSKKQDLLNWSLGKEHTLELRDFFSEDPYKYR